MHYKILYRDVKPQYQQVLKAGVGVILSYFHGYIWRLAFINSKCTEPEFHFELSVVWAIRSLYVIDMGLITTKPVFGVSYKARLKPVSLRLARK